MRATVFTAAIVLAVLTSACAGVDDVPAGELPVDETPAETEVPEPTDEPEDDVVDAEMTVTGRLAGDADLEGGCAWLETDDGSRYEILYPNGYQIAFDPLQLTGPDGEVVASDGEQVTVHGSIADDMVSICQVGTLFSAESVEHD